MSMETMLMCLQKNTGVFYTMHPFSLWCYLALLESLAKPVLWFRLQEIQRLTPLLRNTSCYY